MLSTTLTFNNQVDLSKFNSLFVKKRKNNQFDIYLEKSDKLLGHILVLNNVVTLEYSSELLLEEYIIIHDVISLLIEGTDVKVDDSKSFLGYLSDGEPAYIHTNWGRWIDHINHSMKKCL
jgi:hypothetical protein